MLSDKPPTISTPVITAFKAPMCTIGGIPDASHITAGISTTKSNAPSRYPNISFKVFTLPSFFPAPHHCVITPSAIFLPASKARCRSSCQCSSR